MTSFFVKSSFPKVVVGNPLFVVVVLLRNDRSPTKFLGDDNHGNDRSRIKTFRDDGTLRVADLFPLF
ncbi:hypothetical protein [Candidatus Avelusimicrobium stercoris]|uniref:hypothetical protein n=1 Tax=Candidatus Avelusimicrobium stercoris TaxID=1947924 RepID=UPI003D132B0A